MGKSYGRSYGGVLWEGLMGSLMEVLQDHGFLFRFQSFGGLIFISEADSKSYGGLMGRPCAHKTY